MHAKIRCVLAYFEARMEDFTGAPSAVAPAAAAAGAAAAPEAKTADKPAPGPVSIIRRQLSKEDKAMLTSAALAASTVPLVEMIVRRKGTFEDDAPALLQTDFANKFIGSSVLEGGAVQEQIRFSINPECLVSIGLNEVMRDDEAIIITGAERISNYKGYDKSFTFTGRAVDKTPFDAQGRRATTIVGIDAIKYNQFAPLQFSEAAMLRDIGKAYAGYAISDAELGYKCEGVATGNWGCGAFHGAVDLKSMLLWIVVSLTGRTAHYFPYGDKRADQLDAVVALVRSFKKGNAGAASSAAAAAGPDSAAADADVAAGSAPAAAGAAADAAEPWSTEVTVGDLWRMILAFCKGHEAEFSAAYYPVKKHKSPKLAARPVAPLPDLYGHVLASIKAMQK